MHSILKFMCGGDLKYNAHAVFDFLSYLLLLVSYAHYCLSSALMLLIDCLETDFNLLIISVTY